MGAAGWRGGITDLCPGRQKPSRRYCTNASRGLSATAEFVVPLRCGLLRALHPRCCGFCGERGLKHGTVNYCPSLNPSPLYGVTICKPPRTTSHSWVWSLFSMHAPNAARPYNVGQDCSINVQAS